MKGSGRMKLKIRKMKEQDAITISFWQYTKPYDWYNLNGCKECVEEFLEDNYYTVLNHEEQVVGFYCYGKSAQVSIGKLNDLYEDTTYTDIGLGMNPLLCGKGYGPSFVKLGMEYAKNKFKSQKFRLTVADFNVRAVKTYEKVGFKNMGAFKKQSIRFIVMCYEEKRFPENDDF